MMQFTSLIPQRSCILLKKMQALLFIYLIISLSWSTGSFAQDSASAAATETTDGTTGTIDYDDPAVYQDPAFFSNPEVDYGSIRWDLVTDQSIIPVENIYRIPPEVIDVSEVSDVAQLTTEQLTYGTNLEKVGDLSKVNSNNLNRALQQRFSLGSVTFVLIEGVILKNNMLVNERACSLAAGEAEERICGLSLNMEELKGTGVTVTATTTGTAGQQFPGFTICSKEGTECRQVRGTLESVEIQADGSAVLTTTNGQKTILQSGELTSIVDEAGNSILFMGEEAVLTTHGMTIVAHGSDPQTRITLTQDTVIIVGPAEFGSKTLEGITAGVVEIAFDEEDNIVSVVGTKTSILSHEEPLSVEVNGDFSATFKNEHIATVALTTTDASNPSYLKVGEVKKIQAVEQQPLLVQMSEQLEGDGLALSSYLHWREGSAVKREELENLFTNSPEKAREQFSALGIQCEEKEECLIAFDLREQELRGAVSSILGNVVFVTRDGNEFVNRGYVEIDSYEILNGQRITNSYESTDSETFGMYDTQNHMLLLDNNQDIETFAIVRNGIILNDKQGTYLGTQTITTSYGKENGIAHVRANVHDALALQGKLNDLSDEGIALDQIDVTAAANIFPVSNDGSRAHVIINEDFTTAFLTVATQRGGESETQIAVTGGSGILAKVLQYQREFAAKGTVVSLLAEQAQQLHLEAEQLARQGDTEQASAREAQAAELMQNAQTIQDAEYEDLSKALDKEAFLAEYGEGTPEYTAYKALYEGLLEATSNENARERFTVFYEYAQTTEGVVSNVLQAVALRNIAETYFNEGDFNSAIETYQQISSDIRTDQDTADLAQLYLRAEKYQEARELYTAMKEEGVIQGYEGLAQVALAEGKRDEASRMYVEAYNHAATDAEKQYVVSQLVQLAGASTSTEVTGDTAVIAQEFEQVLTTLGITLTTSEREQLKDSYTALRLGTYAQTASGEEQHTALEQAIALDERNLENIKAMIGVTSGEEREEYLAMMENELNRRARESAFKEDLNRERAELLVIRTEEYLKSGKKDEALLAARLAVVFDSTNIYAQMQYGQLLASDKRYRDAEAYYHAAVTQAAEQGLSQKQVQSIVDHYMSTYLVEGRRVGDAEKFLRTVQQETGFDLRPVYADALRSVDLSNTVALAQQGNAKALGALRTTYANAVVGEGMKGRDLALALEVQAIQKKETFGEQQQALDALITTYGGDATLQTAQGVVTLRGLQQQLLGQMQQQQAEVSRELLSENERIEEKIQDLNNEHLNLLDVGSGIMGGDREDYSSEEREQRSQRREEITQEIAALRTQQEQLEAVAHQQYISRATTLSDEQLQTEITALQETIRSAEDKRNREELERQLLVLQTAQRYNDLNDLSVAQIDLGQRHQSLLAAEDEAKFDLFGVDTRAALEVEAEFAYLTARYQQYALSLGDPAGQDNAFADEFLQVEGDDPVKEDILRTMQEVSVLRKEFKGLGGSTIDQLATLRKNEDRIERLQGRRVSAENSELRGPFEPIIGWLGDKAGLWGEEIYAAEVETAQINQEIDSLVAENKRILQAVDTRTVTDAQVRDTIDREFILHALATRETALGQIKYTADSYINRQAGGKSIDAADVSTISARGLGSTFYALSGWLDEDYAALLDEQGTLSDQAATTTAVFRIAKRKGLTLEQIQTMSNEELAAQGITEFGISEINAFKEQGIADVNSLVREPLQSDAGDFQEGLLDSLTNVQGTLLMGGVSKALARGTKFVMSSVTVVGDNAAAAATNLVARGGILSRAAPAANAVAKTAEVITTVANKVATSGLNPFVMSSKIEEGTTAALSSAIKSIAGKRIVKSAVGKAAKSGRSVGLGGESVGSVTKGIVKHYIFEIGVEEVVLPGIVHNIGGGYLDEVLDPLEMVTGARRGRVTLSFTNTITSDGRVASYSSYTGDIRRVMEDYEQRGFKVTPIGVAGKYGPTAIKIENPQMPKAQPLIIAVSGSAYDAQALRLSTERNRIIQIDGFTEPVSIVEVNKPIDQEVMDQLVSANYRDLLLTYRDFEEVTVTLENGETRTGYLYADSGGQKLALQQEDPSRISGVFGGKSRLEKIQEIRFSDREVVPARATTRETLLAEGISAVLESEDVPADLSAAVKNKLYQEEGVRAFFWRLTKPEILFKRDIFMTADKAVAEVAADAVAVMRTSTPADGLEQLRQMGLLSGDYTPKVADPTLTTYVEEARTGAIKENKKVIAALTQRQRVVEEVKNTGDIQRLEPLLAPAVFAQLEAAQANGKEVTPLLELIEQQLAKEVASSQERLKRLGVAAEVPVEVPVVEQQFVDELQGLIAERNDLLEELQDPFLRNRVQAEQRLAVVEQRIAEISPTATTEETAVTEVEEVSEETETRAIQLELTSLQRAIFESVLAANDVDVSQGTGLPQVVDRTDEKFKQRVDLIREELSSLAGEAANQRPLIDAVAEVFADACSFCAIDPTLFQERVRVKLRERGVTVEDEIVAQFLEIAGRQTRMTKLILAQELLEHETNTKVLSREKRKENAERALALLTEYLSDTQTDADTVTVKRRVLAVKLVSVANLVLAGYAADLQAKEEYLYSAGTALKAVDQENAERILALVRDDTRKEREETVEEITVVDEETAVDEEQTIVDRLESAVLGTLSDTTLKAAASLPAIDLGSAAEVSAAVAASLVVPGTGQVVVGVSKAQDAAEETLEKRVEEVWRTRVRTLQSLMQEPFEEDIVETLFLRPDLKAVLLRGKPAALVDVGLTDDSLEKRLALVTELREKVDALREDGMNVKVVVSVVPTLSKRYQNQLRITLYDVDLARDAINSFKDEKLLEGSPVLTKEQIEKANRDDAGLHEVVKEFHDIGGRMSVRTLIGVILGYGKQNTIGYMSINALVEKFKKLALTEGNALHTYFSERDMMEQVRNWNAENVRMFMQSALFPAPRQELNINLEGLFTEEERAFILNGFRYSAEVRTGGFTFPQDMGWATYNTEETEALIAKYNRLFAIEKEELERLRAEDEEVALAAREEEIDLGEIVDEEINKGLLASLQERNKYAVADFMALPSATQDKVKAQLTEEQQRWLEKQIFIRKNIKPFAEAYGLPPIGTSVRDNSQLKDSQNDIFGIGTDELISAHGVEDKKGGLSTLASIILQGEITSIDYGPLRDGDPNYMAGPHGPFYVLIAPQMPDTGALSWQQRDQHDLYLVPTDADRGVLKTMLERAVSEGLIDVDIAQEAIKKIVTYKEFIVGASLADVDVDVVEEIDTSEAERVVIEYTQEHRVKNKRVAELEAEERKKREQEKREALKSSEYAAWDDVDALNAELERLSEEKAALSGKVSSREITFQTYREEGEILDEKMIHITTRIDQLTEERLQRVEQARSITEALEIESGVAVEEQPQETELDESPEEYSEQAESASLEALVDRQSDTVVQGRMRVLASVIERFDQQTREKVMWKSAGDKGRSQPYPADVAPYLISNLEQLVDVETLTLREDADDIIFSDELEPLLAEDKEALLADLQQTLSMTATFQRAGYTVVDSVGSGSKQTIIERELGSLLEGQRGGALIVADAAGKKYVVKSAITENRIAEEKAKGDKSAFLRVAKTGSAVRLGLIDNNKKEKLGVELQKAFAKKLRLALTIPEVETRTVAGQEFIFVEYLTNAKTLRQVRNDDPDVLERINPEVRRFHRYFRRLIGDSDAHGNNYLVVDNKLVKIDSELALSGLHPYNVVGYAKDPLVVVGDKQKDFEQFFAAAEEMLNDGTFAAAITQAGFTAEETPVILEYLQERVRYQEMDITNILNAGNNKLGPVLAGLDVDKALENKARLLRTLGLAADTAVDEEIEKVPIAAEPFLEGRIIDDAESIRAALAENAPELSESIENQIRTRQITVSNGKMVFNYMRDGSTSRRPIIMTMSEEGKITLGIGKETGEYSAAAEILGSYYARKAGIRSPRARAMQYEGETVLFSEYVPHVQTPTSNEVKASVEGGLVPILLAGAIQYTEGGPYYYFDRSTGNYFKDRDGNIHMIDFEGGVTKGYYAMPFSAALQLAQLGHIDTEKGMEQFASERKVYEEIKAGDYRKEIRMQLQEGGLEQILSGEELEEIVDYYTQQFEAFEQHLRTLHEAAVAAIHAQEVEREAERLYEKAEFGRAAEKIRENIALPEQGIKIPWDTTHFWEIRYEIYLRFEQRRNQILLGKKEPSRAEEERIDYYYETKLVDLENLVATARTEEEKRIFLKEVQKLSDIKDKFEALSLKTDIERRARELLEKYGYGEAEEESSIAEAVKAEQEATQQPFFASVKKWFVRSLKWGAISLVAVFILGVFRGLAEAAEIVTTQAPLDGVSAGVVIAAVPALGVFSMGLARIVSFMKGSKFKVAERRDSSYGPPRVNEDAVFTDAEKGIMLVADGMGGHSGGEVASAATAEIVSKALQEEIDTASSLEEVEAILEQAVADAQNALIQKTKENDALTGLGTTLSAGVLWEDSSGQKWFVGVNVGDSRIYHKKKSGEVVQVTRDDSVVGELARQGSITEEEAETHLARAVVTKAVLAERTALEEHQKIRVKVETGDMIFAVSDGVSDNLGSKRTLDIAAANKKPEALVNALVDEAKRISLAPRTEFERRRAKKDDITAAALVVPKKIPKLTKPAKEQPKETAPRGEDTQKIADVPLTTEQIREKTIRRANEAGFNVGEVVPILLDNTLEEGWTYVGASTSNPDRLKVTKPEQQSLAFSLEQMLEARERARQWAITKAVYAANDGSVAVGLSTEKLNELGLVDGEATDADATRLEDAIEDAAGIDAPQRNCRSGSLQCNWDVGVTTVSGKPVTEANVEEALGDVIRAQERKASESPLNVFALKTDRTKLYHGSGIPGTRVFQPALEQTFGSGLYLTSEKQRAEEYAKLRAGTKYFGELKFMEGIEIPEEFVPVLYEFEADDLRFLDLREQEALDATFSLWVKYIQEKKEEILEQEYNLYKNSGGNEVGSQRRRQWMENMLNEIINIESRRQAGTFENELNRNHLLRGSQGRINLYFTKFVKEHGFDGLIAYEGGEKRGALEVGEHDTWVIFEPEQVTFITETNINEKEIIQQAVTTTPEGSTELQLETSEPNELALVIGELTETDAARLEKAIEDAAEINAPQRNCRTGSLRCNWDAGTATASGEPVTETDVEDALGEIVYEQSQQTEKPPAFTVPSHPVVTFLRVAFRPKMVVAAGIGSLLFGPAGVLAVSVYNAWSMRISFQNLFLAYSAQQNMNKLISGDLKKEAEAKVWFEENSYNAELELSRISTDNDDPYMRTEALTLLSSIQTAFGINAIAYALRYDADPAVREHAAQVLGVLLDKESLKEHEKEIAVNALQERRKQEWDERVLMRIDQALKIQTPQEIPKKPLALVIDDIAIQRNAVASIIQELGYEVFAPASWSELNTFMGEHAVSGKIDLVVSDNRLEGAAWSDAPPGSELLAMMETAPAASTASLIFRSHSEGSDVIPKGSRIKVYPKEVSGVRDMIKLEIKLAAEMLASTDEQMRARAHRAFFKLANNPPGALREMAIEIMKAEGLNVEEILDAAQGFESPVVQTSPPGVEIAREESAIRAEIAAETLERETPVAELPTGPPQTGLLAFIAGIPFIGTLLASGTAQAAELVQESPAITATVGAVLFTLPALALAGYGIHKWNQYRMEKRIEQNDIFTSGESVSLETTGIIRTDPLEQRIKQTVLAVFDILEGKEITTNEEEKEAITYAVRSLITEGDEETIRNNLNALGVSAPLVNIIITVTREIKDVEATAESLFNTLRNIISKETGDDILDEAEVVPVIKIFAANLFLEKAMETKDALLLLETFDEFYRTKTSAGEITDKEQTLSNTLDAVIRKTETQLKVRELSPEFEQFKSIETIEDVERFLRSLSVNYEKYVNTELEGDWMHCGLGSSLLSTLIRAYVPGAEVREASGMVFKADFGYDKGQFKEGIIALRGIVEEVNEQLRERGIDEQVTFSYMSGLLTDSFGKYLSLSKVLEDIDDEYQLQRNPQREEISQVFKEVLTEKKLEKIRSIDRKWGHTYLEVTLNGGKVYILDVTQKQFDYELPVLEFYPKEDIIGTNGLYYSADGFEVPKKSGQLSLRDAFALEIIEKHLLKNADQTYRKEVYKKAEAADLVMRMSGEVVDDAEETSAFEQEAASEQETPVAELPTGPPQTGLLAFIAGIPFIGTLFSPDVAMAAEPLATFSPTLISNLIAVFIVLATPIVMSGLMLYGSKRLADYIILSRQIKENIALLSSEDASVRAGARDTLVKIGKPAVPALIKALKDSHVNARLHAAITLGKIKDISAIPALIEALNDPDAGVRERATWALSEIKDPLAVPALIKRLNDPNVNVNVKVSAVIVLTKIDDPLVIPALIEALKDQNEVVKRSVIWGLEEKRKEPSHIDSLLSQFNALDLTKDLSTASSHFKVLASISNLESIKDKLTEYDNLHPVFKQTLEQEGYLEAEEFGALVYAIRRYLPLEERGVLEERVNSRLQQYPVSLSTIRTANDRSYKTEDYFTQKSKLRLIDLAKLDTLTEFLSTDNGRDIIARNIVDDLTHWGSELGGLASLDADGNLMLEPDRDVCRGDNCRLVHSAQSAEKVQNTFFDWHQHATQPRGDNQVVGPSGDFVYGTGDRGTARLIRSDGVVITFLGGNQFNVHYYTPQGVVINLGDYAWDTATVPQLTEERIKEIEEYYAEAEAAFKRNKPLAAQITGDSELNPRQQLVAMRALEEGSKGEAAVDLLVSEGIQRNVAEGIVMRLESTTPAEAADIVMRMSSEVVDDAEEILFPNLPVYHSSFTGNDLSTFNSFLTEGGRADKADGSGQGKGLYVYSSRERAVSHAFDDSISRRETTEGYPMIIQFDGNIDLSHWDLDYETFAPELSRFLADNLELLTSIPDGAIKINDGDLITSKTKLSAGGNNIIFRYRAEGTLSGGSTQVGIDEEGNLRSASTISSVFTYLVENNAEAKAFKKELMLQAKDKPIALKYRGDEPLEVKSVEVFINGEWVDKDTFLARVGSPTESKIQTALEQETPVAELSTGPPKTGLLTFIAGIPLIGALFSSDIAMAAEPLAQQGPTALTMLTIGIIAAVAFPAVVAMAYGVGELHDYLRDYLLQKKIEKNIQALKDPDENVRENVKTALAYMGEPAVQALIEALNNPDENIRFGSLLALAEINDSPAVNALMRFFTLTDANLIAIGEPLANIREMYPSTNEEDSKKRNKLTGILLTLRQKVAQSRRLVYLPEPVSFTPDQKEELIATINRLNAWYDEIYSNKDKKISMEMRGFPEIQKIATETQRYAYWGIMKDLRNIAVQISGGRGEFAQLIVALEDVRSDTPEISNTLNDMLYALFKRNGMYINIRPSHDPKDATTIETGTIISSSRSDPPLSNEYIDTVSQTGIFRDSYKGKDFEVLFVKNDRAVFGGYSEHVSTSTSTGAGFSEAKRIVVHVRDRLDLKQREKNIQNTLIHEIKHKEDQIDNLYQYMTTGDGEARAMLAELIHGNDQVGHLNRMIVEYGKKDPFHEPHQYAYNFIVHAFIRAHENQERVQKASEEEIKTLARGLIDQYKADVQGDQLLQQVARDIWNDPLTKTHDMLAARNLPQQQAEIVSKVGESGDDSKRSSFMELDEEGEQSIHAFKEVHPALFHDTFTRQSDISTVIDLPLVTEESASPSLQPAIEQTLAAAEQYASNPEKENACSSCPVVFQQLRQAIADQNYEQALQLLHPETSMEAGELQDTGLGILLAEIDTGEASAHIDKALAMIDNTLEGAEELRESLEQLKEELTPKIQKLFMQTKKGEVRFLDTEYYLSGELNSPVQGESADAVLKKLKEIVAGDGELKKVLQEELREKRYFEAAYLQRDQSPTLEEGTIASVADQFLKEWDPEYQKFTPQKNPYLVFQEYPKRKKAPWNANTFDTRELLPLMEKNIIGFSILDDPIGNHDVTVTYQRARFRAFAGTKQPYEIWKGSVVTMLRRIVEEDVKKGNIKGEEKSQRLEVLKSLIFE